MILDFDPRPIWKKDAWWIIETHIVEDVSPFDDGIERIGEKIYFHKYRVVDEQQINGKDLWIIDIIAHKVPSEFTNDHGDNYLWRLYIDKENLTLSRFEMANRGQRYLVTGPEVQKTTYDFLNNKPVVSISVITLTPNEIPQLPSGDIPRKHSSNEKDF